MRSLSHAELQRITEHRIAWCAGCRHPDIWDTLSDEQQILVNRVEHGARAYHDALLAERRERALRLRWGEE